MNLRVRYMDVRVKFKDDNESWVYDSNDPHSRKNALGYESLPGNTLEVRLNPATGQVLNVRGGETIYRILGRDDLAGEANSIFLDRFNQELYIYADGPLDIGQQWTRTFNVAAPYGLQYVHTFTLEKHKKKQGFLKRESQISTGMMPGNLYADNRKFSLTGTQTAELNVDLESGIIYGLVAHTELKGQQKMPAGPGRENPVKTPIQVKIDLISEMSMK
ncbi:MAG TPA: hypothetical protein ENJ82_02910 [Bacteroidetes bacterium]|nr:hypothetical protein [Bacteroidota bacterium]